MKKCIAIILVLAAMVVIDQKPWRSDESASVKNDTAYAYSTQNDNNYSYQYGYGNSYGYGTHYNNNYDDYFGQDDSFTMECYRCYGSGRCEDCGGNGKSKLTGVLAMSGCALCDASGRCYKCNGKGYTIHY